MKFVSCILLCLVLLSVFCGYGVALVSSSTSNVTVACCSQNASFEVSTNAPMYTILGDPIDSPKPNTH